jgi:hypothetical protein
MELPQYTLRPNINRMVVPWIFKLLGLSVLFYGGVYFNARYALGTSIPAYVNLLIFFFLIVLIATQAVLYHVKFGRYQYLFYTNRVDFEGKKTKTFMFSEFTEAKLKQGIFDRMFGTGSIALGKDFSIGPISNVEQMKSYLEQLVQYYRTSEERYRMQQQEVQMQREMARQPQQQAQPQMQQAAQQQSQQPAQQASSQQQPGGGVQ